MVETDPRSPDTAPTGLPEEEPAREAPPLGVEQAEPEGDGEIRRGERAMPGIPTEGEPPGAG